VANREQRRKFYRKGLEEEEVRMDAWGLGGMGWMEIKVVVILVNRELVMPAPVGSGSFSVWDGRGLPFQAATALLPFKLLPSRLGRTEKLTFFSKESEKLLSLTCIATF
jgi:hypothetical protein